MPSVAEPLHVVRPRVEPEELGPRAVAPPMAAHVEVDDLRLLP